MTDHRLPTLHKLGLLTTLYFAQGLPFGFFVQALPLLLRAQGYSLSAIGLSSLLALPWALKFLWAPAVDRLHHRALGRRRSWILPLQAATVVTLVALAMAPTERWTPLLLAGALLLNLLAATQDIATDGLAVDMLTADERGVANGIQVAGYRVGMVVGGGALLIVHHRLGSSLTFLAMAALTAVATIPIAAHREAAPAALPAVAPAACGHFLRRPDAGRILALVVLYKLGESFASGMLRPFLADAGLDLADIGWMLGTVGFTCGLLGAVAGGVIVNRLGRRNALLAFGVLQAITVAGYAWLAMTSPGRAALTAISAIEHLVGGMATAALFTCMMDWSRPQAGATDYTVQASAVVIATGTATAVSGFSAQALGYSGHFALATVVTAGAVVAVLALYPPASSHGGRP